MHRRTDGSVRTVISYTRYEVEDGFDVESMEFHDFFGSLDWQIDSDMTSACLLPICASVPLR